MRGARGGVLPERCVRSHNMRCVRGDVREGQRSEDVWRWGVDREERDLRTFRPLYHVGHVDQHIYLNAAVRGGEGFTITHMILYTSHTCATAAACARVPQVLRPRPHPSPPVLSVSSPLTAHPTPASPISHRNAPVKRSTAPSCPRPRPQPRRPLRPRPPRRQPSPPPPPP